ncbi:MAG: EAL domain-containing protein [Acidimicrobiia bacterium]|nr:EAL domain-containing protein [Acidimicrobiia bacterium]
MVVSTVLVALELSRQSANVHVLNVAAELPALTYEITDTISQPDLAQRQTELATLESQLASFSRNYLGLRFGDEALDLPGAPSQEVDRLLSLADPLFNQVVTIGRSAVTTTPSESDLVLLELSSAAFRSRMEGVVFEYQRETEARVQSLARLEFLLLSGGLLLLIFEGLFLFRPAARANRRTWQEAKTRHAAERAQDRAELEYLAQFDPLTELPNRMLFRDRGEQAIRRAERSGGWVSILFVNLDNFSVVNDQLGHEVGDQLLKQAAERISSTVRTADTVAHLGGDEFAVVVEGADDTIAPEAVATKVLTELSQAYLIAGQALEVSASVGVAVYPVDAEDADSLLRDAALAMYAAKDAGKNGFEFYTAELRARTSDRLTLVSSFKKALASPGQLVLWYQPKIELSTGRISGMEALIRWNHPEKGLVMPDEFIPMAEDTGLVTQLDEWVIHEACRQMSEWTDAGMEDMSMSVNISSRQFHHAKLAGTVQACLLDAGVAPGLLELEVTEGMLIENIEAATVTLDQLRELGVRISIDDFGTGYSSLSYLKRLPIDVLKIDRSFIMALPGDTDDAAISEAIVRLGQTLHLEVVAEGVETQAQYDFLSGLGCDTVQGYHIAAPLPALEFAQFVAAAPQRLAS